MAEEINLNPVMSDVVIKELDRRAAAVASKETAWMYQRYAYINISTTGKTQTALCPKQWSLGSAPAGKHTNLYSTESGVRKMKPTITSVKMVNDGGQSYTDSYIWTIEFAFKVFTIDDLDLAEASFFIVGAEVAFDFGWMGTEIKDGVNNTPSNKPMLANVYNFSFSQTDDGGFNCTVKCMSPEGLWPKESMGDVEKLKDLTDTEEPKFASYLDALKTSLARAFGVDNNATTAESIDAAQNVLEHAEGELTVGGTTFTAQFWSAQIVAKHGWAFMNDTEQYEAYTNLDTLIQYINAKLKYSKSSFRYKIAANEGGKIHPIYELASADPTKIILPGEYSQYTQADSAMDADGKFSLLIAPILFGTIIKAGYDTATGAPDAIRDFDWRASSAIGTVAGTNLIKNILISIDYMNDVYLKLSDASTRKSGGQKAPPNIQDFLQKVFNDIDQMTGGLVSIMTMPENANQDTKSTINPNNPSTIIVANKRKAVDTNVPIKPYEFETLSKRSITKSVSLASDFEAETLMHASKSSLSYGKSNFGALVNLYPECTGVGGTPKEEEVDECSDGEDCSEVEELDKGGEAKTTNSTTGTDNEGDSADLDAPFDVAAAVNQTTDPYIDPNPPIVANTNGGSVYVNEMDGQLQHYEQERVDLQIETAATQAVFGGDGRITYYDCMAAKGKYIKGYSSQMIASTQDLFRSYLAQQVERGDDRLAGSQFTEVVWMLKLSVTIDGIFGIKYLTPITVDRLPKVYRTEKDKAAKAYFSITSIEHSFDGQGGWETALDTVMRIQG